MEVVREAYIKSGPCCTVDLNIAERVDYERRVFPSPTSWALPRKRNGLEGMRSGGPAIDITKRKRVTSNVDKEKKPQIKAFHNVLQVSQQPLTYKLLILTTATGTESRWPLLSILVLRLS